MPEMAEAKGKSAIKIITWDITENQVVERIKRCSRDEFAKILVGEAVEVPDQENPVKEIFNNGFVGTVKALKCNYATVANQDENCFDIEVSKLTVML